VEAAHTRCPDDRGGRRKAVYEGAGAEYYERNGATPHWTSTSWLAASRARWCRSRSRDGFDAARTRPGQRADARRAHGLLRAALPVGAELELSSHRAPPALFDPNSRHCSSRRTRYGARVVASRRSCARAAASRSSPSSPARASRDRRGFGLPGDAIHAADESTSCTASSGRGASRELYQALAQLPARASR